MSGALCMVVGCRRESSVLLVIGGNRVGYVCPECGAGCGHLSRAVGSVPMMVRIMQLPRGWKLVDGPGDRPDLLLRRVVPSPAHADRAAHDADRIGAQDTRTRPEDQDAEDHGTVRHDDPTPRGVGTFHG